MGNERSYDFVVNVDQVLCHFHCNMPYALLVNDDGPPSKSSPYVLDLYQQLIAKGWRVRVVLPSSRT